MLLVGLGLVVAACEWRSTDSYSGPPLTVLWVVIYNSHPAPEWLFNTPSLGWLKIHVGRADTARRTTPPYVSRTVWLNSETKFAWGEVDGGPHYVRIDGWPASCTLESPNPQFVDVAVGSYSRPEFELRCS
jgi:hypothetical protein